MQQETKSNIWQVFDTLCVWLFNLSGTWKIKEGQKKHEDTASRIIWGLWQDKWISHGKVRFPECVSLGNGNRGVCVRRVTSTQVTSQQQSDPAVSVLTALLITVRTEDGLGELFCMWGVSYRILTSHFTSLLFFSLSAHNRAGALLCAPLVFLSYQLVIEKPVTQTQGRGFFISCRSIYNLEESLILTIHKKSEKQGRWSPRWNTSWYKFTSSWEVQDRNVTFPSLLLFSTAFVCLSA